MTIHNFINFDHCWLRFKKHSWGPKVNYPEYDYMMIDPNSHTPYVQECEECGALQSSIHYKETK